jgi:tetratricopeptide (TPR) repeat protein
MLMAIKSQPTQGRRIKTYGTGFIRYFPEYYLGLINIKLGHYEAGLKQLENVRNADLIRTGDPEFDELVRLSKFAEEQLAPKPAEARHEPVAPVAKPDETADTLQHIRVLLNESKFDEAREVLKQVSEKNPQASAFADILAEINQREASFEETLQKETTQRQFQALMKSAEESLRKDDFASAREFSRRASALGLDTQSTRDLQARIERAEQTVARKAAQSRAAVQENAPPAPDLLLREALHAYYAGKYQDAVLLLNRIESVSSSAEVQFYLGASHASLGLLQGRQGREILQKGMQYFARCRQLDPAFQVEHRYISPRILELYQKSEVAGTIVR